MLIEKEVARPGKYWYTDQKTGLPRCLEVTPELTKYWCTQGTAMLNAGLHVPVPYEHDFNAHPMTPKEKLLNNAGEVKEYRMKGDRLFSVVDVQDPDVKNKIGRSIRWTSPWINSFTDGAGREWKNVISHLALTTRPRIIDQTPFNSISAAMSMATEVAVSDDKLPPGGICLSNAGRLFVGKKTKRLRARYPLAFSMWAGGIPLAEDDLPTPKKKSKSPSEGGGEDSAETDDFTDDLPDEEAAPKESGEETEGGKPGEGGGKPPASDAPPAMQDPMGDVSMEELLCDLLQSLGVPMPDQSDEAQFKRHLYEAVMSKIKELTSKGMGKEDPNMPDGPDQNQPPDQQPNASQPNPLIQQEQQPMFMSLEDIQKLPDPMKGVALAMHNENVKLRAEMEASKKTTDSLRDAKLKEAKEKRDLRVSVLSRMSKGVKADLDAMLALPSMALSLGEGGTVIDPMATTLTILEKSLADMPALLTTDRAALSIAQQPSDETMLSDARADEIADNMARQMGCAPQAKAS